MPRLVPDVGLLASIPSPDFNTLDIGPLSIHIYGLMIALGIVAGTLFARARWQAKGHDGNDVLDIVIWVVIAGVIGARLYHVATDYQRFEGHWERAFEIWKGGLGIWGGVAAGSLAVIVLCRWRKYDGLGILDAMAPGIALAQAIGRWGNWFNQELFGEPTTLPWALEIDPVNRPAGFRDVATFHPTFLYESLYSLVVVVGVLLWAERRFQLKRGQVFALYIPLYTFGRFWLENLRIDDANLVAGLRVNAWVSAALFVFGIAWFVWLGRRDLRHEEASPTDAAESPRTS
jgi:prolipoprotein diacylglyceryl transferase